MVELMPVPEDLTRILAELAKLDKLRTDFEKFLAEFALVRCDIMAMHEKIDLLVEKEIAEKAAGAR